MTQRAGPSPPAATESLPRSLLDEPIADDDAPGERWAYGPVDMLLVSLFVALHATLLLVSSSPSTGLARGTHWVFDRYLEMSSYMAVTGNTPSWNLFAPDPPRGNFFVKVLLEDSRERVWDLQHDIYGRRRYPYLFFDRMGKVNQRLLEDRRYQQPYAAWACRAWERLHPHDPARSVRLVRMWTRIPSPEAAYHSMGYHPLLLDVGERDELRVECASTPHGQLPDALRARFGMGPAPEGAFRDVRSHTWWDRRSGLPDPSGSPDVGEPRTLGAIE